MSTKNLNRVLAAAVAAAMSVATIGARAIHAGASGAVISGPSFGGGSPTALRESGSIVPAGTVLALTMDSYVASDRSRIEDEVRAHLRRPVTVDGYTAIPAGSTIVGHVTRAERSGRVSGRAELAFRFDRLSVARAGENVRIATSPVVVEAQATKGEDAKKIGLPAVGGAIIGAITGGKKGAAIGAAAGGGIGTAVVLSTRGNEVELGHGSLVRVRLLEPVYVSARR